MLNFFKRDASDLNHESQLVRLNFDTSQGKASVSVCLLQTMIRHHEFNLRLKSATDLATLAAIDLSPQPGQPSLALA